MKTRGSVDTSGMVIIPKPNKKIPTKVIHGWRAYIDNINPVAFQIWRLSMNGAMFELVYHYKYQPNKTGVCEITLPMHERTQLEANGVIGIAVYSRGPIPFTYGCFDNNNDNNNNDKPRVVDRVIDALGSRIQFSRKLRRCRTYSLQVSFAGNFTSRSLFD